MNLFRGRLKRENVLQENIKRRVNSKNIMTKSYRGCSGTFSVDDGGSVFFVVLLGDPRGLEGGERREGRSSLPDSELPVSVSDNSDHGTGRSSGDKLLPESFGHTFVHSGTTGHDDVLAEFSSDINVGGRDGNPGEVINRFATIETV